MKLKNRVALKKVNPKEKKLSRVAAKKPQAIQDILNLLVPNREAMIKAAALKKEKPAAENGELAKEEAVKADVVESK